MFKFPDNMKYFVLMLALCSGLFIQNGAGAKLIDQAQSLDEERYHLHNETYREKSHLKGDELNSACLCVNGTCELEDGKNVCKCLPGFGNYTRSYCKACDCGPRSNCTFSREWESKKTCVCKPGYYEKNGKCVVRENISTSTTDPSTLMSTILTSTTQACLCRNGRCELEDGKEVCKCPPGFGNYTRISCKACDCGPGSNCTFSRDWAPKKTCVCKPGYYEKNGKCVVCKCEQTYKCFVDIDGRESCRCPANFKEMTNEVGKSFCIDCKCHDTYECFVDNEGKAGCRCPAYLKEMSNEEGKSFCVACDCEPPYDCFVKDNGETDCRCPSNATEMANYKGEKLCVACNCEPTYDCFLKDNGETDCRCPSNATELANYKGEKFCMDCNCGSFSKACDWDPAGNKICSCSYGFSQLSGSCVECNCGPYGSCSFEYGRKLCDCKAFAVEKNGVCIVRENISTSTTDPSTLMSTILTSTTQDCFCGRNSISCGYDREGNKICKCLEGYAQLFGICYDCNCGVNSHLCYYRRNGTKVCHCSFGHEQINGYCSAICNEDNCVHGTCEASGNGFKCRCNKGFTGLRCEHEIGIELRKQDLWLIIQVSIMLAIFGVLCGTFCLVARWRKYASKV